ncbi:MAG: hypothetical protein RIC84_26060 [Aggregatilineales bacterium]
MTDERQKNGDTLHGRQTTIIGQGAGERNRIGYNYCACGAFRRGSELSRAITLVGEGSGRPDRRGVAR